MIKIRQHCVYGECYWNGNGRYQKEYEEMRAANWETTKAYWTMSKRYYRFFNDGDLPYRGMGNETEIANRLEADMDARIASEYKRFKRAKKI